MNGFIITGTHSGCGKTTVSMGLMSLLQSLNYNVAPFKTGPDYIDPLFHKRVLGKTSYNLDSYMLSEEGVKYLFNKHVQNADVAIIEGVMGMYDGLGYDALGSGYHLGKTLNVPAVLVVGCQALYQSVAAIVKGFATLKKDARVAGVILNHVPSDAYYQFLKEVIEKETQIPCLGYVPNNSEYALESRHLGLVQAEEVDHLDQKISLLRDTLQNTIDVERLMEITQIEDSKTGGIEIPQIDLSHLVIGVAYDKAFRFYYQDNLELLKELGAEICEFSPINDVEIPSRCNALYIGGGYPEVFAKELSLNRSMKNSIAKAVERGVPVYAECGGLMYLTEGIKQRDKSFDSMVGIFDCYTEMTEKLKRFGYAELSYAGETCRCHEFHKSHIVEKNDPRNYRLEYQLEKKEKGQRWECGLMYKNCLAGYAHIHFYSNLDYFKKIVELWKRAIM